MEVRDAPGRGQQAKRMAKGTKQHSGNGNSNHPRQLKNTVALAFRNTSAVTNSNDDDDNYNSILQKKIANG
jgi:hypothetical protein